MKTGKILILLFMVVLIFSTVVVAEATLVNVASTYPPDSPLHKGLVMFKELVEKRTDNRFEILIHAAEAMGDARQTVQLLSQGSVEMGAIGTADFSYYYPKYYVFDVPFVLSSEDEFWKFWQGPGKEVLVLIEKEKGIRSRGVILRGAEYLSSNKLIKSVEDVKGLKLRMYPTPWVVQAWESIGAIVTQIAFSEVYLSLKTGIVEAQTNPLETILAYKFYEVQKYLIPTKHQFSSGRYVYSSKWWNTLSKEDQTLFDEALDESTAHVNSIIKDGKDEYLRQLQEFGMTIVDVDIKSIRKAIMPYLDHLAKNEWDYDFWVKVQEAIK